MANSTRNAAFWAHIAWIKVFGGVAVALYPVLVYFGLQHFDPRWLALFLVVVVGVRLFGQHLPAKVGLGMVVAVGAATVLTLTTGSELGLLLYPVLMNAAFFVVFLASWIYPPTVIETIARLQEPELPPAALGYLRKLTLVWVGFFAFNGSVAALSIPLGREAWALYNGLIAYVLMAALFLGELLVRRKFKSAHHA